MNLAVQAILKEIKIGNPQDEEDLWNEVREDKNVEAIGNITFKVSILLFLPWLLMIIINYS